MIGQAFSHTEDEKCHDTPGAREVTSERIMNGKVLSKHVFLPLTVNT